MIFQRNNTTLCTVAVLIREKLTVFFSQDEDIPTAVI